MKTLLKTGGTPRQNLARLCAHKLRQQLCVLQTRKAKKMNELELDRKEKTLQASKHAKKSLLCSNGPV